MTTLRKTAGIASAAAAFALSAAAALAANAPAGSSGHALWQTKIPCIAMA